MATKLKYKSEALEAVHSAASGMYRAGTIDKATMREFDESCLIAPAPWPTPHQAHSREPACQPARLRPLSQHQRIHH